VLIFDFVIEFLLTSVFFLTRSAATVGLR
jgi:hypothetical protein